MKSVGAILLTEYIAQVSTDIRRSFFWGVIDYANVHLEYYKGNG